MMKEGPGRLSEDSGCIENEYYEAHGCMEGSPHPNPLPEGEGARETLTHRARGFCQRGNQKVPSPPSGERVRVEARCATAITTFGVLRHSSGAATNEQHVSAGPDNDKGVPP